MKTAIALGHHPQQPHPVVDTRERARAGYDGAKRRKGSKAHIAVDTLGQLLALYVTAASEQDRAGFRVGPTGAGGDGRQCQVGFC